ncbi:MAG TPA: DMT family transporter [Pyrinomonadaceae bacterium]|nr:DMT family transporter [Pyrinomonadaceae bacterium]
MTTKMHRGVSLTGVSFAMLAAVLFGASTPFSKILLGKTEPVLLAGLLYLGSGVGLTIWSLFRSLSKSSTREARLKRSDLPWLAGAILAGGIIGPVLLLLGLAITAASSASLLLNLEGVFTAVLAWFVFKENFDRRIALGMAAITLGGLVLSWGGRLEVGVPWGALTITGACLAWGIDNNLTRRVSAGDPVQIAAIKGLVAGAVNLTIALAIGTQVPAFSTVTMAALLGFFGYGVSLTLFVLALRHIGTARTGAYFSLAPFVGALISVLILRDSLTLQFLIAAVLMGIGVWLHLTERHAHEHLHEAIEHDHRHVHDEHHQHEHDESVSLEEPHSHPHRHERMMHSHPHYPDIHHRHDH